jgi:hypothetical protein
MLQELADSGDVGAARVLAKLLLRSDVSALEGRAARGDIEAIKALANRSEIEGDLDRAEKLLKNVFSVDGSPDVARRLAVLLDRRGRSSASADLLYPLVRAGDKTAARQLAIILAREERIDELNALADAGDRHSSKQLALLYARRNDVKSLARRADAGDARAARSLASLLARRGDTAALRSRASAGDRRAARQLAKILAKEDILEAKGLLRKFADVGDRDAAAQLVQLLVTTRDDQGLFEEVRKGTEHAAHAWIDMLEIIDPKRAKSVRNEGLAPPSSVEEV